MKKKLTLETDIKQRTLKEAFKQFITEKKTMNLSIETIKSYERVFKQFTKFYNDEHYCSETTLNDIHEFINDKKEGMPNISEITINMYLRHIRAIFYHFMEQGYMERFDIKLAKADVPIKETYSDHEIQLLLTKPNIKKVSFSEYRNWVIVNYLLGTGNRLSTVCNLKIKDIDLDSRDIYLTKVKNRKQYIIPLSTELKKVLIEYLQYRNGEPDDYLFCNQFGTKLENRSMQTAIEKYNNARGISKTSIHLFRHTFAKLWILNGGDSFSLQKMLGHSSSEMTRIYVNMYGNDLKDRYDEVNPLDNASPKNNGRAAIRIRK